jgi:hypothetical protein
MVGYVKKIEADILEGGGTEKYLINKATGKRIKTREKHTGLTNRGWGNRWGWDNSVEGSVDFGVEFVDGNAIFYACLQKYQDRSNAFNDDRFCCPHGCGCTSFNWR